MTTASRIAISAFTALTLLSSAAIPASAQTCAGPVKIIVAYPPGAPDDVIARMLAQKLGASGEPVIVENMPGASGKIGNAAAARAAPDGCTLLVVNSNVAVQAAGDSKTPYNIMTSFAPIALLTEAPETISVNPAVPARTMQELVVLLKANPGKYSYASPGFASSPHLAGENLFRQTLGLDVAHVPHQGGPPAVSSTMGGHTNIVHLTLPVVASAVRDGKLRMLAVADKHRHPMFPDVPTLAEAGIANHEVGFWNALLAPRGTPQAVLDKLHSQVGAILGSAEMRSRLEAMGYTPKTGSQAEVTGHIANDINKMKVVLARTKITLE
jgi:tripartite-type tricarboxylate transporter receptor subunit TctC